MPKGMQSSLERPYAFMNIHNSLSYSYSKRHNKFLFPSPAKAIYGSLCRAENEIFNAVNYNDIGNLLYRLLFLHSNPLHKFKINQEFPVK